MTKNTKFKQVKMSLVDLLGPDYIEAVISARANLSGEDKAVFKKIAREKIDFFPDTMRVGLEKLLPRVGAVITKTLSKSPTGASSKAYNEATDINRSPLSGWGYYRLAEDGRLYFISKSEHYHTPLGHGFPGYRLVENARKLGIPNATHNNTRGYITRLLEEKLICAANNINPDNKKDVAELIASKNPSVLNRVLNMETGSLAMETAIKLVLSRFYKVQPNSSQPEYQDKTPVVVVIGNDEGCLQANYHGTTVLGQILRGMWPGLNILFDKYGIMKTVAVRPDNMEDVDAVFRKYNKGKYRIAGIFFELILMNYGGLKLTKQFVRRIHALCVKYNVPTVVDEIQTGFWSPEIYMFREYGVSPSMVAIGKGFPGGEYCSSRIIFNSRFDVLPQFGALVTNGQEELASLAYLIGIRWLEENGPVINQIGGYYEKRLRGLIRQYPGLLIRIEGSRHMSSIYFNEIEKAKIFVDMMTKKGLDISVQNYKPDCPVAVLTKLPLITDFAAVDMAIQKMGEGLKAAIYQGP